MPKEYIELCEGVRIPLTPTFISLHEFLAFRKSAPRFRRAKAYRMAS